jgi:hypothetical protein
MRLWYDCSLIIKWLGILSCGMKSLDRGLRETCGAVMQDVVLGLVRVGYANRGLLYVEFWRNDR